MVTITDRRGQKGRAEIGKDIQVMDLPIRMLAHRAFTHPAILGDVATPGGEFRIESRLAAADFVARGLASLVVVKPVMVEPMEVKIEAPVEFKADPVGVDGPRRSVSQQGSSKNRSRCR